MRSLRNLSVFAFALCVSLPALADKQTNFLFFLVDDMGWADIGANATF